MRPLTEFLPKPLVPVRGQPVVARTIEELARAGCSEVAVNLFHRGDDIRQVLGDEQAGIPITYSQEVILQGTLGALWPLREFLRPADLAIVVNGDSLCRWPIKRLVRRHLRRGAASTLLVSSRVDPAPFGGGITVDKRGIVASMRPRLPLGKDERCRLFMGAHVFSPQLLDRLEQGPANFVPDLYEPMLAAGETIGTVKTRRSWHDLGTPKRYLRGVLSWGRRRGWTSPKAEVGRGSKLRQVVVEAGARIGPRCQINGSLILSGARIGPGSRVRGSIIGPDVELPKNTSVEGRMVTRVREESAPAKGTAVLVGGLQFKEL